MPPISRSSRSLASTSAPNAIWATQFVLNLLAAQHHELTPTRKARVSEVVAHLATMPGPHRTLSVLAGLLGPELGAVIKPYTLDAPAAATVRSSTPSKTTFGSPRGSMSRWDTSWRSARRSIVPALDYLFRRVEQSLRRQPDAHDPRRGLALPEAPHLCGRLQAWLKTLRKKNVYVIFATQDIADAADSPILPTILSACPTKIYLPNEEALTPKIAAAYASFGLTDTEITIIAQAQKKRDYYYRSVHGRRLFTLDLGPTALAFAGMSTPADQLSSTKSSLRTRPPGRRGDPSKPRTRGGRRGRRGRRPRSRPLSLMRRKTPMLPPGPRRIPHAFSPTLRPARAQTVVVDQQPLAEHQDRAPDRAARHQHREPAASDGDAAPVSNPEPPDHRSHLDLGLLTAINQGI